MNLLLVSAAGLTLFLWPFFGLGLPPETPALAVTLGSIAAFAVLEVEARRLDSGRLALLAALAAIDAALRLALVTGIGGFSAIFFLVLAAGYVFGASYGFTVGAFALLVSAVVTGGIGPWLPYEMFAVGWTGAAAGMAGSAVRMIRARTTQAGRLESGRAKDDGLASGPGWLPDRLDIAALVAVAIVTGFAYGALMDIWGWVAFYRDVESIGWAPGLSAGEALAQFGRYYVVTSLAWDTFRAAGDALAVLVLGPPVLMALGRLRARLGYEVVTGEPV
jgi:energy-coupling factor transport system substrate-specific component